jgi:hypothetical protein
MQRCSLIWVFESWWMIVFGSIIAKEGEDTAWEVINAFFFVT